MQLHQTADKAIRESSDALCESSYYNERLQLSIALDKAIIDYAKKA